MKIDFFEMKLSDFAIMCSEHYMELLEACPKLKEIDFTDENYIIRISNDGIVEIGYPSDVWSIGPDR